MWSRNNQFLKYESRNQWPCNHSARKIWQQSTQMMWVQIQLWTSAVVVHSWIWACCIELQWEGRYRTRQWNKCGIDLLLHVLLRPLLRWFVQCWTLKKEKEGAWKEAGEISKSSWKMGNGDLRSCTPVFGWLEAFEWMNPGTLVITGLL